MTDRRDGLERGGRVLVGTMSSTWPRSRTRIPPGAMSTRPARSRVCSVSFPFDRCQTPQNSCGPRRWQRDPRRPVGPGPAVGDRRRTQRCTSHPDLCHRLQDDEHQTTVRADRDPAWADRPAGLPRPAGPGRRRRRLVGDVPRRSAGLPRPPVPTPTSKPGWSRSPTVRRSTRCAPRRADHDQSPSRPNGPARPPTRTPTAGCGPAGGPCRTSNARLSPCTTSPDCHMRRLPSASAAPLRLPAGPPPTASRPFAAATRPAHDHDQKERLS